MILPSSWLKSTDRIGSWCQNRSLNERLCSGFPVCDRSAGRIPLNALHTSRGQVCSIGDNYPRCSHAFSMSQNTIMSLKRVFLPGHVIDLPVEGQGRGNRLLQAGCPRHMTHPARIPKMPGVTIPSRPVASLPWLCNPWVIPGSGNEEWQARVNRGNQKKRYESLLSRR